MANKTCTTFVLLKDGQPVKLYQTEWYKHSHSFSMNHRDMFSFMWGVCTALGDAYSFDTFDPNKVYSVTLLEV